MRIRYHPAYQRTKKGAEDTISLLRKSGKDKLADSLKITLDSIEESRFVIGIIGATKRGKSTLVNALMGRKDDNLAPIAMLPITNCVSIFSYSQTSRISVWFTDRPDKPELITEPEIRLFATEKHNAGNRKMVRSIEVMSPQIDLEEGTYLVDTPGTGNALEEMHTDILLNFLPNADAVVFLVTGEKPITESERSLLKVVRKRDIPKIFFAINMLDRVESGDISAEEFAQGIQHNREILKSINLQPEIYTISAKNYFQYRKDAGTEKLLCDIQSTIREEKLNLHIEKLKNQTISALNICNIDLKRNYNESISSTDEIILELKSLQTTKLDLRDSKKDREYQFSENWNQAFTELEDGAMAIRRQLRSEYRDYIEKLSSHETAALNSTIHADIINRFSELIEPEIKKCEDVIITAQRKLIDNARTTTLRPSTSIESPITPISQAKGSLDIALAGLPAVVTGTITSLLPGLIGGAILSSAPTSTVLLLSPTTWGAGIVSTVVTATGAAMTTALATVAIPCSLLAFGAGAYRVHSAWKQELNKNKNTLINSTMQQIDEVHKQIVDQIRKYQDGKNQILENFHQYLELEIRNTEDRLSDLISKQKSEKETELTKLLLVDFESCQEIILNDLKNTENSQGNPEKSLAESFIKIQTQSNA
jgi:GTPase Era involved in 16S rRNA processing